MLTRFDGCTSVALCLDTQLVASKANPLLPQSGPSCTFSRSQAKTAGPPTVTPWKRGRFSCRVKPLGGAALPVLRSVPLMIRASAPEQFGNGTV
jgi:hypothetical protein